MRNINAEKSGSSKSAMEKKEHSPYETYFSGKREVP